MKSKKKRKKIIIAILLVAVLVLAFLWLSFNRKEMPYEEEVAKTQDITTYYSFSGNIGAKDSQEVLSKGMMPVKEFYVEEGDLVEKGDLLLLLDDSDTASNVDQAIASVDLARISYDKAMTTQKDQQLAQVKSTLDAAQLTYDHAKLNLERTRVLFEGGESSKQALEQAQTSYDNAKMQLDLAIENMSITEKTIEQNIETAKAQLDQAQANLTAAKKQVNDVEVRSEISGEIAEIYVEEDDSLMTGTKIMNIVDYENLEVTIKVDEYDLNAVTLGKEVNVTINPLERDVIGTVSKISKEAETVNGVSFFTAYIDLKQDPELRVGLSVEVKALNKDAKAATTLSMKALQFGNDNQPFVYYRGLNNEVAMKPVKLGINDGNTVQILEGVKPGEIVLLPPTTAMPATFGMDPASHRGPENEN